MMYTIGQVAKMYNLAPSTLRYYDKEGLFVNINRTSGIRKFSQSDVETLRMIECLKKTGMEIKEIKTFMQLCAMGSSTFPQRKKLFEERKKAVEADIEKLQKVLAMVEFKCWYYDKAIQDGTDEEVKAMLPDKLPKDIQQLYDVSHK